jgi:hypothetical protein
MADNVTNLNGNSIPVPTTDELYDFFNTFIYKWLKLPSKKVAAVENDIQILPNEEGLLFSEPAPGILVLRTSEAFATGLAKLAKLKEVPTDLFLEMIVVFWHRFVGNFWKLDSRQLPPILFKKTFPRHWPDRKPDSHLIVFILEQPVELRIWVNLSEEEKERWKSR